MSRLDPHSFADAAQPRVTHLDWHARVDFDTRTLSCMARLEIDPGHGGGPLDLDTRDLSIRWVRVGDAKAEFTLGTPDPVLGQALRVLLPAGADEVSIGYDTAEKASALQWLAPEQTRDGAPFVFSQCQAIHARSLVPIQDTPSRRITFEATLDVPVKLRGLMAARFEKRREDGARAIERYAMPQPIPPYLLAFAVGKLESRELGPRSRVWAEPSDVARAAWEFASVDHMLRASEQLFGEYEWERFDLLVMPPSFPYGGMENPRLTFLTPTLLAGDRSLVNVVAHELAHSWTGNLVTNATAEHFWLNEGWTVYAERHIVQALEGTDRSELDAALGRRTLTKEIARFQDRPQLTCLRTRLEGIDPDDAFSSVPYEKGYLFLRLLEETAGRDRFAGFVRKYIATFRFTAITTDEFLAFLRAELPDVVGKVDVAAWIDTPGVPANAPVARSARLEKVEAVGARLPTHDEAKHWSATEWQLYLAALPLPPPAGLCEALDAEYKLNASGNMEVLVGWLLAALSARYAPALDRTAEVLGQVGRMKFLRPLYKALHERADTKALAAELFAKHRAGYHPIAQQVVGALLA